MAITHVSALEDAVGGTSVSITLPATQADDIVVVEFGHRSTTNPTTGGTFTPALTLKHTQLLNSSNWEAYTWWARCTGDHNGETITASTAVSQSAFIVNIYRGAVATGDPLADATIVGEQNASGDNAQAQITTATDAAMVVLLNARGGQTQANQAATDPATLTERIDSEGASFALTHSSAEKATAGGTGSFSWTLSFDVVNGSWAYAITPAAAAPTGKGNLNESPLTHSALNYSSLHR